MVEMISTCVSGCIDKKNPTYKRKLDDVAKRMDILFHRLAHKKVDVNFIAGLQDLATGLHARNYMHATNCYKRLVTCNPEETGTFMVGIKTLIHVAKSLPL